MECRRGLAMRILSVRSASAQCAPNFNKIWQCDTELLMIPQIFPAHFFGMGQNRSPNFSEMGPNYSRSHSTFEVFDMSLRFETTELVQVD